MFEGTKLEVVEEVRNNVGDTSCTIEGCDTKQSIIHVLFPGEGVTARVCVGCLDEFNGIVGDEVTYIAHDIGPNCEMPGTSWYDPEDPTLSSRCILEA